MLVQSKHCKGVSRDVIHAPGAHSIYTPTPYYVNSDMAIPLGLARNLVMSELTEGTRRIGFPPNNRLPEVTPLVLAPGRVPLPRSRNG